MGLRGTPQIPWYLYEVRSLLLCRVNADFIQTIWDDVSPVALTDALVQKHCANGARIQV
jgi:hypothetical protein